MTLPWILVVIVIAHASSFGFDAEIISTLIVRRFRTESACEEAAKMLREQWQSMKRVASRGQAKCIKD